MTLNSIIKQEMYKTNFFFINKKDGNLPNWGMKVYFVTANPLKTVTLLKGMRCNDEPGLYWPTLAVGKSEEHVKLGEII